MQNSNAICKFNDEVCKFSSLDERLRNYLIAFVRYKGRISKIKREMNITRNEVKNLNNELLSVIAVVPKKREKTIPVKKFSTVTEYIGERFVFNMYNR